MHTSCPHCHKEIDIVGAAELKADFGIGPNSLQHARDRGKFPEPWLSFGNRNLWLRETIRNYVETRSRLKIEQTVTELAGAIRNLPEVEREEAVELLTSMSVLEGARAAPTRTRTKKK